MSKSIWLGMLVMCGAIGVPATSTGESLVSLRGAVQIPDDSVAPVKARIINDKEIIDRTFEEQPPLVPHKVDQYAINLGENECMDCHSKEKAKEKDATEVSESHYKTSDGTKLDTLAARRYFCNQCHVPQIDADPLIANEFKSVPMTK